jgi:hypothetical protein
VVGWDYDKFYIFVNIQIKVSCGPALYQKQAEDHGRKPVSIYFLNYLVCFDNFAASPLNGFRINEVWRMALV